MTKTQLSEGMTSLGRPAQYQRPSRKGKKAWRKHIDLSTTEAALEDIREQERVMGTAAHSQKNQDLFVEDRRGQETQLARQAREKRKLKSQEILAQRSAVPAVQQKARSSFQLDTKTAAGKANAAGLPEKVKKRLRMLASRPHEGLQGDDEHGSAGKFQSDAVLAEKHDLWGAPEPKLENEWITPAMKSAVQKPKSMHHEPAAPAKSLSAVSKPHPGISYNPDFDSHDSLIQRAFEKAKEEERDENELRQWREQLRNVAQGNDQATALSMKIDDPATNDDELQDEEEDENDDVSQRTKLPTRKTAAQRRREARAKEQYNQAQQRRKERQMRALMSEASSHSKKLAKAAEERAKLIEQRREAKLARMRESGMAGSKVGKYVVPEARIDVQTGDELSESLRQLKPEGNLFWDRFQNLQARGLTDSRRLVQPMRRRLKTKTYDRHTFKRD
ncbi:hypothetical protein MCAP1_003140 [Malassezia caprae]|uniref:Ribosome biogenesis protein NOP53 n=1 Tax=Malassezia caprae TaxID=1381934 RepID=A0AAF0EAI9_9BASI|nr:hypothetical protein MCAP1_003140 [Malassezia caprae]